MKIQGIPIHVFGSLNPVLAPLFTIGYLSSERWPAFIFPEDEDEDEDEGGTFCFYVCFNFALILLCYVVFS